MIAIIDYGAGNIKSVEKALNFLGEKTVISSDRDIIQRADRVILPGVGSFGSAMKKIRQLKIDETIKEIIKKDTPFLGICLGLQLLFDESEESPGERGLGIFKGVIKRIPKKDGLKVPHMGWNSLEFPKESRLFKGIDREKTFVYFVHSYYLEAEDRNIVSATAGYSVKIDAAVERKNIFATQFHPEKSSRVGLNILRNFIEA